MIVQIESSGRIVLLAVDATVGVAELVARLQLLATYLTEKAVHVVDTVVGAHDLLVAQYGLLTRVTHAAHTPRPVHLEVVVATQNHLLARETLLAQVVQSHFAHVTFEALHVPETVQTLEQVAVAYGRVTRGA